MPDMTIEQAKEVIKTRFPNIKNRANFAICFFLASSEDFVTELRVFFKISQEGDAKYTVTDEMRNSKFCQAACFGRIEIMKLLIELTTDPVKRKEMIHSHNDKAFKTAVEKGHIKVVKLLNDNIPGSIHYWKMIKEGVKIAAKNNQLECLMYLCILVDEKDIKEIITNIGSEASNEIKPYITDIEKFKSLVASYSPAALTFMKETINFMEAAKNPLSYELQLPKDVMINILYQGSSVKDKISYEEAGKILEIVKEINEKIIKDKDLPKIFNNPILNHIIEAIPKLLSYTCSGKDMKSYYSISKDKDPYNKVIGVANFVERFSEKTSKKDDKSLTK